MKQDIIEHIEIHRSAYIYIAVFLFGSILVGMLSYSLLFRRTLNTSTNQQELVEINVFIQQNDTLISTLSSEIKELRQIMEKRQKDTICVTITRGK